MKLGNRELEPVSENESISTIEARKLFMEQILERAPEIVFDLLKISNDDAGVANGMHDRHRGADFFEQYSEDSTLSAQTADSLQTGEGVPNAPVFHYFKYFQEDQRRYSSLLRQQRVRLYELLLAPSEEQVTQASLESWIPNWTALNSRPKSKGLRRSVSDWAARSNLNSQWCLDFALIVLRNFKTFYVNENQPVGESLEIGFMLQHVRRSSVESWRRAAIELAPLGLSESVSIIEKYPNLPQFEFDWMTKSGDRRRVAFTIRETYNPFLQDRQEFSTKIEFELWNYIIRNCPASPYRLLGRVDEVRENLRKFQSKLRRCFSKVDAIRSEDVVPSTEKISGYEHFRWLVDYQISEFSFRQIAKKNGKDRKVIERGVKNASRLVGIPLRISRRGRPEGSKDKTLRNRVA